MSFTKEQILNHYRSEVEQHGLDGTITIKDDRTRRLEVEALSSYIRNGYRVLETGCGNGYVAQMIVEKFEVELDGIDFSPEMIELAQKRELRQARGRVKFTLQDILTFDSVEEYDLAITERCLQNLVSWEDQKTALGNIVRSLKPGGYFVLLESFWTGLNNLNEARSDLDLPPIEPQWHNLFFDEEETKIYMSDLGCSYIDQNPFLSGYYFGSRVMLPALIPKGKPVSSKTVLNDYFCSFPPSGDFCPMKILRFVKN